MYRVLCDGVPIHDLTSKEEAVLINPKVTLEINKAGSFEFKMPPNHPEYDLPKKMKSCIQVYHDNIEIFNGRPIEQKIDFYNRKTISCEGQLAYLNDSIQRPAEYHNMTVRGYLETLIEIHNSQVDESRQFEVGIVTVKDSNDSLFRYTNYNNTMKEIKEDLIDNLGGYVRVRNYNGHRYLDYVTLDDYGDRNTQVIEFGENLLDFSRNVDVTDIATAIIPLGAKVEGQGIEALEERLTIASINDGVDYIQNTDAVNTYGMIVKTVIWDDVTTPQMLLSKAQKYLSDYQFDNMTIEAKAIDLHYTDEQIEQFKLGDRIRVVSEPHGLDRYFPLTKMTIMLDSLSSNSITLGESGKSSLTSHVSSIESGVHKVEEITPLPSEIVQEAINQATALITAATRGYVVTTANEQLIMDTNDVETATKVWRWNLNGLGYSNTGYNGKYKTAITMDGQIVGEMLVANSVSAEKIDITYRSQVEKEISDAESNATSSANGYTDEKLQNYYTKGQIETTIQNTANSILLSAKEAAEQYTDNKVANYVTQSDLEVSTDNILLEVSKNYTSVTKAEEIAESAADSVKDDILVSFGDTLSSYSTKVETEAAIKAAANEIKLSVSESIMYNFCTNPDFTEGNDGLSGWTTTGSFNKVQIFNEENCLALAKNNSATWKFVGDTNKIFIAFKAAKETSNSYIEVYVNNEKIGEIGRNDLPTNLTEFLFEVDLSDSNVSVELRHRYYSNWDAVYYVYITDVRILGEQSKNVQSQIEILGDRITAEVERATGQESSLRSLITQTEESITSEVRKKVGSDEIISKINQTAESVTINASKINFNGVVTANNRFKILTDGSFTAAYGTIGGWNVRTSYIQSTNGDTTLYNDGRIKIGYATLDSESGACVVKYGLHVYAASNSFDDGSRRIKFFNLQHVTSGGHVVFASDGATLAYLSSSSKRYKDHISDLTLEDAEKILNVPVVWFKYKTGYLDPSDVLVDKQLPGLYAEDVYKALPEAVQYNADGDVEDWNYRVLIPVMLKLIQNLYTEVRKNE